MRRVSVSRTFPGSVHEAETCWYDTSAWPLWVDGLDHVEAVQGPWPDTGAMVTWRSGPAGRGRVTERVTSFEALEGQTVTVSDDSIDGRQTVAFTPVDDGVAVALSLEYAIKERNLFTPLIDFLFIRRAMEMSLSNTLGAFAAQLADRRAI